MQKEFICIILFLFQQLALFSQPDKYNISKDKKGYLTMTNKSTNEVKFEKCNSIDTIPVIFKNTDESYKNYLIIRIGKKRTFFNTQNDKIIFSGEIDTIKFGDIPDDYYPDDVLPKKMVIKVITVKKEKYGGMNINVKTGKIIALSNYPDQFNHDRSLVKLYKTRANWKVVDLNGKTIVGGDAELLDDIKKAFIVRKDNSYFKRGKVGVIDTKGDTVVPFHYRCLDFFAGNYFFAWDTLEKHCGIIDIHNKLIVPFEYIPDLYFDTYVNKNFPTYLYSDLGVAVLKKSSKKGDLVLVDTMNTILVKDGTYTEIRSLNDKTSNRFFSVTSPTDLKGIYDAKLKKELFPCEYASFGGSFSINNNTYFLKKGIMVAEKGGRWGLLNLETGKISIPFEYDTKDIIFEKDSVQDYFLLKKNGKMGMIDITGRILISFNYDNISESMKGFIIVKNNGLYGLFDANTYKELLPAEYSKVEKGVHFEKNETNGRMEGHTSILLEKIEGTQLKKGFYSKTGGVIWD